MSAGPGARWARAAVTAVVVAGAALLVVLALTLIFSSDSDQIGWDLRIAYLPAADAVWDGRSPYPDPDDPNLDLPRTYVYPPQLAIALVPLSWLPADLAAFLAFLASVAALSGALALVGVRDVRCYAAMLLWAPVWNSLDTLNVSSALALGVALLWRFRATVWPLAATLAAMVSVKLFLWPLVVWVGSTRRLVPAALALGIGLTLTFVSWAVIGFAGFADYPDLLSRVGEQESYSIAGMSAELGLGQRFGRGLATVVGLVLLGIAVREGRRQDSVRAFTLAVAATLALSPVVWLHYLTLLIAPLGLARPRFSPLWLLPIVLWVSPRDENGEGLHPFIPAVVAIALIALLLARRPAHRELEGAS
jgi:alpha-1,2-mannosyltransferase